MYCELGTCTILISGKVALSIKNKRELRKEE